MQTARPDRARKAAGKRNAQQRPRPSPMRRRRWRVTLAAVVEAVVVALGLEWLGDLAQLALARGRVAVLAPADGVHGVARVGGGQEDAEVVARGGEVVV